jgi:hypothetical protein
MPTTRQVLTDALVELGVYSVAETPSAADISIVLSVLNRLLDNWNAERAAVYVETFASFTLVPSLQVHTIGPAAETPTWEVTQRPVSIDGADVAINNVSPTIYTPITVHTDPNWWQSLAVPGITSEYPTDLYYEPAWPLGRVYLWPVPTSAFDVRLQLRVVLGSLGLADEFSLPPGYRDAITLTVAERAARAFGKALDPSLRLDASKARAVIFRNNDLPVPIQTADSGMPRGGRGPYFNYRNGQLC